MIYNAQISFYVRVFDIFADIFFWKKLANILPYFAIHPVIVVDTRDTLFIPQNRPYRRVW